PARPKPTPPEAPSPRPRRRSRSSQFLIQLIQQFQRPVLVPERPHEAPAAATFRERGDREVPGLHTHIDSDGVLYPLQPPQLVLGELHARLPLPQQPALEALLDHRTVRPQLLVRSQLEADQPHQITQGRLLART